MAQKTQLLSLLIVSFFTLQLFVFAGLLAVRATSGEVFDSDGCGYCSQRYNANDHYGGDDL